LGRIFDGRLACAYHGWRFGADGACTHIPSLTQGREIAAGIGVRSFPCREQDGLVWVWTGLRETSTVPPSIPNYAGRVWTQGAIDLACEAMMPIENNLDICHPYFTHPRLHPQWFAIERAGFRELAYELLLTATGLEVTSQGVRLAFCLPDRVTVEGGPGAPLIVLHHTPTTVGRCRQHWLVSLKAASADASAGISWSDELPEIFEQDRCVMESAQLAYAIEGGTFERSVKADAPTLMARRIVRMAAAGRWEQDRVRLSQRRRVLVRG